MATSAGIPTEPTLRKIDAATYHHLFETGHIAVDERVLLIEGAIEEKLRLYAGAGIVEYWIVNLIDRVLETHRESFGDTYRHSLTLTAEDHVSLPRLGLESIPVEKLL